ncbi:MAG: 4-hydroxy-3-methylbut-2-enyl diphosphate reductase [Bacteroidia bacterium]|jgi:4-hydroxy-3-methylbut-2-enyl diphosphate reductase
MEVTIDVNSGFCFGVVFAIQMAEDELNQSGSLYCLGDIVHNNMEVERLQAKGLKIINHEQFAQLSNTKVLIRAHGEPPETYRTAIENNIELIDASCPVVLKLQNRIRNGYEHVGEGQIVVYGKAGHAEVNGLVGQTNGRAIIVESIDDLDKLDYSKPIQFFSQTTQPTEGFRQMRTEIERRITEAGSDNLLQLESNDTLCRQVSNREPQLREFAAAHDVILFVAGKKSSNGWVLYNVCKEINPNAYFVSSWDEVNLDWFETESRIGICGATSTPMWLMEEIASNLKSSEMQRITN